MVGAYAPNEDSDECVKDDFYDGLQQVNQVIILLGDFNANINPMDGAIVGPYGCWKRSTNENGLWLLNLCWPLWPRANNHLEQHQNKGHIHIQRQRSTSIMLPFGECTCTPYARTQFFGGCRNSFPLQITTLSGAY